MRAWRAESEKSVGTRTFFILITTHLRERPGRGILAPDRGRVKVLS